MIQDGPDLLPAKNGAIVSLSDICMTYNTGNCSTQVLSDINFEIQQGEFICLLGPSGCGKTTLLNIIAGFIKPSAGRAMVDGLIIRGPDWNRGFVFQSPTLYPWLNVRENVEFGLKMRKFSRKEREALSDKYLEQVGLRDFKYHKSYELSGGMRQRACLARVLVNDPRIILMDEPFGALDALTRENMHQLTRIIWSANHGTFFLITHDVDEALSLATRVMVMSPRPGRIVREFKTEFTYHISGDGTDKTRFSKEYISIREQILWIIHNQNGNYII
ncbi:MAG: ABC transporter ATP-binding protein [Spirochaetaceae bacterium]|jgi:taurine transport system ATP-binding protein|nr:ABC transporter ATP-binding protein [Spirochaetaceae bacterium]